MASAVYVLCTLTTLLCAALLLRGYLRGRKRLLLWSGLCFAGLTLSNGLMFVDLVLLQETRQIYTARLVTAAAAMLLLVYGLVWDAEER
ncbi:MAG TPA: DUF5985 family protein [Steroidobacteraceae bacterium]|nr:DUF5985 family protein [Steroidobacteraceae bacterium]